jgi:hypothetical protein
VSPQGVGRALARNGAARALWHALPEQGQRRVMRSYQRGAAVVARWNRRAAPNRASANAGPSPETLARLREHYAPDHARLCSLLGGPPPWPLADRAPAPAAQQPGSPP